jgi:pimeloyl-ACP methyl ester carboxylesterase
MKGFGSAPKPDDGSYSPRDHAELIHRLILQRDLRRVTLVGHSLGGGVALLTALSLLDDGTGRLHRMVIVAGAAYRQRLPPFVTLARHRRLSTALMRCLGARRMVRFVLRTIVHRPKDVTRHQVEGYADPLSTHEARAALIATALQIQPPDLEATTRRYPEIDVPALLLWGRHDRVVPLSVGESLVRALPQGHLVVLEECGHLPAEELPDESLKVLGAFLEGDGLNYPA